MEIKELNYLIAIAEEKSISKAADRLYMAQSSLSQFLQTLESSLDSKLFVRTSRGVRLTEAGTIMLKYAYATLAEYHRTQDEIQDLKDLKSGSVILGISGFRGSYLLPPVLNAFKLDYPGIRVPDRRAKLHGPGTDAVKRRDRCGSSGASGFRFQNPAHLCHER